MAMQVPSNPDKEGKRVKTEHGEAVFTGYCWVEAGLWDAWQRDEQTPQPPDVEPLEGDDNPLLISEVGTCDCGAPWGNAVKSVTCVFCGRFVSLT